MGQSGVGSRDRWERLLELQLNDQKTKKMGLWEKHSAGCWNSMCKGPKAEMCLAGQGLKTWPVCVEQSNKGEGGKEEAGEVGKDQILQAL